MENVILKVTRGCNLHCKYCHMLDKTEWRDESVSDEVLCALIARIAKERNEFNDFSITLHGGEASILGPQRIEEILEILTRELNKYPNLRKKCRFSMQTNGTLLTEKWIPLLKKYKVGVSISFDGVVGTNELRCNSSDRIISSIELLRKNDVDLGCLAVVSKTSLKDIPNTIAFFEKNHLGYKINRCEDIDPNSKEAISFEDYYDNVFYPTAMLYLKKSKNFALLNGRVFLNDRIEIALKEHLALLDGENISGCNSRICEITPCGTASRVIAINADGTIQPCGRVAEKKHILGDVRDYRFLGLFDVVNRVNIIKEQLIRNKRLGCDNCELQNICSCPCWAFDQEKPENVRLQEEKDSCEYNIKVHNFVKEHYSDLKKCFKEGK